MNTPDTPPFSATSPSPLRLFVSVSGNDTWSGKLRHPNSEGTDGPCATPLGALRNRRRTQKEMERVSTVIEIGGGRYFLAEPLELTPADSHLHFCARDNETPIFDGGITIRGWREEMVSGRRIWRTDCTDILREYGYFHQLFVNGRRARRPRLPGDGSFFRIQEAAETDPRENDSRAPFQKERFIAAENDIIPWKNLNDVQVVIIHWWIEERRNIASFNPDTREVRLCEPTKFILVDDLNPAFARYYIENVGEALSRPGEWYLDRTEGSLLYLPFSEERLASAEIIAPVQERLVVLQGGDTDTNSAAVGDIVFCNIHFEHGAWNTVNRSAQGAFHVPAAIELNHAYSCGFEKCVIRNSGNWACNISQHCRDIILHSCSFSNLGAGAIKVHGPNTSDIFITNNTINDIGLVHHSAVAVFIGKAHGVKVCNNHIHHTYYTGISAGFCWGYREICTSNIVLEGNHIHHCGQGLLNDMGGIYLLGIQPGTLVRKNCIHDIESRQYGGWGIYPDEGTSYVVFEKNIVYRTSSQSFHLHYGKENSVRNNIFAFGGEGIIAISRGRNLHWPEKNILHEGHEPCSFIFFHNIVITDGMPIFVGGMDDETGNLHTASFYSDLNCFFDTENRALFGVDAGHLMSIEGFRKKYSWDELMSAGYDRHSIIADPCCIDLKNDVFDPVSSSPVWAIGFEPLPPLENFSRDTSANHRVSRTT